MRGGVLCLCERGTDERKENTNRSIGGLMHGGLMNYLSLGHTNEDVKASHLLSISHEIFGGVRIL